MTGVAVTLRGLTKRFGNAAALDDLHLAIAAGEFVALLGPSGSGKTTLLRVLAGLEFAETGTIEIGGRSMHDVPARKRRIGFVFQHYALFRHMTVARNVAFGLEVMPRRDRPQPAAIRARAQELLEFMEIGGLADRYPDQISGGQRQRVALARALAIEPTLLLLDEPFGALDAKVRKDLRIWLRGLHDRMGLTSLFVTHDQAEALEMADRVAVLRAGRIEQVDTPDRLYAEPANAFVHEFLGESIRFDGAVSDGAVRFPLLPGVMLPPAVIRGLLTTNPDEVLQTGWDGLMRDGPSPMIVEMYEQLVSAARRLAEVLAQEDILALEQGTAIADMGQYVAHRQILQTTARLEKRLPARPVKPLVGRKEVPTRVLDEDQYPVGGYTSISTKGSIESLLHSQLAYMERESPDLFDMKFVRDELFYYSRDENQFLRRRRAFVFVLFPDLVAARFKDAELPYQRIVMVQSLVLALVRKLTEWLSTDAIRFEVLFVQEGGKNPLAEEAALLKLLLREPIERGDGEVTEYPNQDAVVRHLNHLSRTAQVHCLAAATEPFAMEMDNVVVTELIVEGPRPEIGEGDGVVGVVEETEDAFDLWQETILRVLQLWV
ncbi:MAG: sulfate ABC transporter ATP-binding protein [Planctomycetes bacterium]|nr:sulfate ABC transporter ATP-binding protein [Planctomycetota bacterium]